SGLSPAYSTSQQGQSGKRREGAVRQFLQSLLPSLDRDRSSIRRINAMRLEFARLDDDQLRNRAAQANDLPEFMAITATVASRVLGQGLFDVQLRGALALTRGSIAEMQTGEGKTMAAVPGGGDR